MGEGGGANRVETGAGNQSITGDYFSKDESGEEQGEGGGEEEEKGKWRIDSSHLPRGKRIRRKNQESR